MADDPSPTTTPTRRVVVVLGMHRSGTSAVAGSLQRLGVDFGPRLMPATEANARGYYEHIDLVNVHDRLLLALGRSWDDTYPFPPDWWRDDALTGRFREDVLGLLRRDFPSAGLWGFKDPRLCRLLPWWEPIWRAVGSEPFFVLVRRAPSEVADSMAKREGFSAAKSHLLWLQHTIEAERGTRGHRRVLLDFHNFLADSPGALAAIGIALGEPWPVPPSMAVAGSEPFIDPALVRSARAGDGTGTLPRWVEEADAAWRCGLAGGEERMRAEFDRLADNLRAAESLYRPMPSEVAADLRHQLAASRQQAAWYEAEWQKSRARAEDVGSKLAIKRQELDKLKIRLIKNDK